MSWQMQPPTVSPQHGSSSRMTPVAIQTAMAAPITWSWAIRAQGLAQHARRKLAAPSQGNSLPHAPAVRWARQPGKRQRDYLDSRLVNSCQTP